MTFVIHSSLLLLSGVYAPVDVLPAWLRILSPLSPMTYVLHGVRAGLLEGAAGQCGGRRSADPGGDGRGADPRRLLVFRAAERFAPADRKAEAERLRRILRRDAPGHAGGSRAAAVRGPKRPSDGVQRPVDLHRQRPPRAGPGCLSVPRGTAGQGRGRQVLEREHLPQDQPERPRARRFRHPADVSQRERLDSRAADHDRRAEAGVGQSDHGGHPVFLVRPLGQEGPAARADHGAADRRHAADGRRESRVDHRSARRPGAGLFQHSRSTS